MGPGSLSMDFRALKRAVSIEQVLLARRALGRLRREGHRLVGPCPVHQGDNPRAFVADLQRNVWYCFTRCGGGGDVVDLVRRFDGVGYREAARVLAEVAHVPPGPMRAAPTTASSSLGSFQPFNRRLALDPDVPFLRQKGIRAATARRLAAGLWRGSGFLSGCIGVRLHDPDGHPLGYAGRRLDPEVSAREGKWKLPPRLPRRELLYNFHRIRGTLDRCVILVECPWAVMRLAQLGLPAVALLGTSLSAVQHELLGRAGRVVLLLDGDAAGRQAARTLSARLTTTVPTVVADLPDGHDPDDLDDEALATCVKPFFSF